MPETKTVDIRGYCQKQLEGLDLDVLRGLCQDRHLPIKPQAHRKTCVARLLEHLTATSAVTVSTASTAQSDAQAKQLSPSDKDQNIASSAVAAHAEPHVDVKQTSSTSDKDSTCSLWYEDKKHSYPPSHTGGSYGFTAKTLVTPKKMLPDGTVEWCDPHTGAKRVYSTSEWNERTAKWEQMYPSLYPTKEPHPHENTSQRGTACSAERRNCWDRLSQTNSDIPSNFANEYVPHRFQVFDSHFNMLFVDTASTNTAMSCASARRRTRCATSMSTTTSPSLEVDRASWTIFLRCNGLLICTLRATD